MGEDTLGQLVSDYNSGIRKPFYRYNSHYTRLLSDREKTIAVYVAKEKKAIIRNDSLIDARFPEGQDLGDFFASNILTIPVKDDSTCVAVIELYRVDGVSYDEVSDGASVLSVLEMKI